MLDERSRVPIKYFKATQSTAAVKSIVADIIRLFQQSLQFLPFRAGYEYGHEIKKKLVENHTVVVGPVLRVVGLPDNSVSLSTREFISSWRGVTTRTDIAGTFRVCAYARFIKV